ncbi:MAG TPA: hypothetical protein VJ499_09125 [Flavisolibacter sp.]|nr:hypothetical protein [Flavisolibacter sp.]
MYRLFKEPLHRRLIGGTKAAQRRCIIVVSWVAQGSKLVVITRLKVLIQEKLSGVGRESTTILCRGSQPPAGQMKTGQLQRPGSTKKPKEAALQATIHVSGAKAKTDLPMRWEYNLMINTRESLIFTHAYHEL